MGEYLNIQDIAGVPHVVAQLSHQSFMEELQPIYETLEPFVEVTVRIARRDINGDIIEPLTSQFVLNVTDTENVEVSACVNTLPTIESNV
jgi:hypothetical protein